MTVAEHSVHYLEIVTPDPEASAQFYGKAYGWSFGPKVPELGGALVASLPDGSRCGIRAPMHDQEKAIVRTYVRVTDLQQTVKDAEQMGADILLPHMEIPGQGTIAIYRYGGIEQGAWQTP